MAITDPTTLAISAITNEGKAALAATPLGTIAFKLVGFKIGKGGYDPSSPNTTVALNPANTALISPLNDPNGVGTPSVVTPFYSIEVPSVNTISPVCRLDTTDTWADYVIGELGIYGEYLVNTGSPALVGTTFLFAHAHFPARGKTSKSVEVFRVVIAL